MCQYKKMEFSNLLILVELAMCFSLSNSAVERKFSFLTTLLNDRRLSMRNDSMEDCFLIAGNNSNWSEQEKEEILTKVVLKSTYRRNGRQGLQTLLKRMCWHLISINQQTMIPRLFLPPAMNVLIWKFIANKIIFLLIFVVLSL